MGVAPYGVLDKGLKDVPASVRENLAGIRLGNENTIVSDPIGQEGFISKLLGEMIACTSEELISIGEKEYK